MTERRNFPRGFETYRAKGWIIHYTCNSPSKKTCQKLGIQWVGARYACDPWEVLAIPETLVIRKRGKTTINAAEIEAMIAKL